MQVRLFRENEQWPHGLVTGFESMPRQFIQHDWVFVVEDDAHIQGILMTAPAHGLVILMRCQMLKDAPVTTLRRLLGWSLRELSRRGYHLWATVLDPTTDAEREIYRLARMWGGEQWPTPAVVVVGLTHKGRRVVQCHS
jgi:hypothetical protein